MQKHFHSIFFLKYKHSQNLTPCLFQNDVTLPLKILLASIFGASLSYKIELSNGKKAKSFG